MLRRSIRAALTNLNLTEGSTAAGLIVLDFLLDVEMVDERIVHYQQRTQGFREVEREEVRLFAAGLNLLNLRLYDGSQYQGTYRHPGYGEFTITLVQRGLNRPIAQPYPNPP